ncbi:2f5a407f-afd8-4164-9640-dc8330180b57 [Sclerotinia trifoliorum]|uniref:2f5a407f-afd8-4164-9640-dc8330180b57 n=1 Tax=Sclerotinia trifoliorum TaxID=28548 RepID=A0A8H2ZNS5_9HELO|nr:2f5a407f-afd8-4164-9640-dc8330180b57 [Sclerotinia trifoliorum]
MDTPSKKSPVKKEPINKVKGGRVEKKNRTPARAAKNTVKSYIDSDDEGDDDDLIIKHEDTNAYDFGRAADGDEDMLGGGGYLGHGNGNARGNGGFVEEDNDFFDAES